ncbi:MAG: hypothetical protein ACI36Y_08695 [Coriobacteriales bacterium]
MLAADQEVRLELVGGDGGGEAPHEDDSADGSKALAKDEVAVPFDSYEYMARPYKKAVAAFEKAGFTNVRAKPIYDLSTPGGGLFSKGENEVEDVSIAGRDRFSEGDVFKKGAKVVVRYHRLEYENPKIKWASRTVAQLFDELDSNAMRAKKAYEGKYLTITGYLDVVDASGGYIALTPSNSGWDINTIRLDLSTDAQRSKVERMSRGDRVSAKVKVESVGEIIGYSVSFYKFA